MKLGRIRFKDKTRFVMLEDEKFLRILNGSDLEDLKETDLILIYSFDKMLAPVKPSKIIILNKNHQFQYIKTENTVVSPSSKILLANEKAYFKIHLAFIIGRERVFGYSLILDIFTDKFGDIRDYALDTYSPMPEFIETEKLLNFSVSITLPSQRFELKIEDIDDKIYYIVKKFFRKLYPKDIIAYDFCEEIFNINDGEDIFIESPFGKIKSTIEKITLI